MRTLMLSSYRVLDSSLDSGCDRSIAYRVLVRPLLCKVILRSVNDSKNKSRSFS